MAVLTPQQQSVLRFIERELTAARPCPSYRDIAAQFGFASKTAAMDHVRALVKKGLLLAEPGKARSIRLAESLRPAGRRAVEIPLFGSIPAGFGRDREQESDECVPVTVESIGFKPTRNTFALRVAGDSMIGRHICMSIACSRDPEPEHLSKGIVAFNRRENPRAGARAVPLHSQLER